MLRGEGWSEGESRSRGTTREGCHLTDDDLTRSMDAPPSPLPPLPMSTWGEGREDCIALRMMTWRDRWTLRPSPPAPSPHEYMGRGEGRFYRLTDDDLARSMDAPPLTPLPPLPMSTWGEGRKILPLREMGTRECCAERNGRGEQEARDFARGEGWERGESRSRGSTREGCHLTDR